MAILHVLVVARGNKFTASKKAVFKMPRPVPEPPRRWWSAFLQANKAGGLLLKAIMKYANIVT